MTTYKERVQAGAAMLDEVLPDWWDGKGKPTIDLDELAMGNPYKCVLGQPFGDYYKGRAALGFADVSHVGDKDFDFDDDVPFGFAEPVGLSLGRSAVAYGRLSDTWRLEIQRRRRAEKARLRSA